MSTATTSLNGLDDRLIERCEELPADPAPGNYVIIDVLHFSNTVIELLANGASHVHVTDERGDEFAYREANPTAKIGGGRTPAFTPTQGYDFFNSPSYVQGLGLDGDPASLWSSNGGRALVALRDRAGPDVDAYVGSTMNALQLGTHLRETDRPTYLVAAGSKGDLAIEDLVGATLISRYLDGVPPARTELELFRRQVRTARGAGYVDRHPIRRRDVCEYAMDFNARGVLPTLRGRSLIDLATGSDRLAVAQPAAD